MADYTVAQSGGDYSTLDEAFDAASNGQTIDITGSWTVDDTRIAICANTGITVTAVGSSKMVGYEAASPSNYRLKPTSGHAITVTASGLTLDGIEIGSESTTTSDECIRIDANTVTLTVKNSLLYFGGRYSQQDLIYVNQKDDATINLENVFGYNAYRSGIGMYNNGAIYNIDVNINSCSFHNLGGENTDPQQRNGIFGHNTGGAGNAHTGTCNVYNSLLNVDSGIAVFNFDFGGSYTVNIDNCVTNVSDWVASWFGSATENISASTLSATFGTTTSQDVMVESVTAGSADMRLKDDTTNNDAQDAHATTPGTNSSLAIPSTDAFGTSRPQNTNYDIGAFEVIAGGVTGTGALASQAAAVSGTGTREITATGALASQAAALSGTGLREITGTAAIASDAAAVAGTGEVGEVVTGTGALASQASSLAGTGLRQITGIGALSAQAAAVAGTGEVAGAAVTGTGALASQSAALSGTGLREITATGALASQASTVAGAGTVGDAITGTGALAAQAAAVSGAGIVGRIGTGALAAQAAALAATGQVLGAVTGTGALSADAATITGVGIREITGTGALASQAASISGAEVVITYDEIALAVTIAREQPLNMTITREVST